MKKHKALFACFLLFLPACLLAGCAGRATPQPAQAEDLMEQYRVWLDEGAAFDPLIDGYTAGIYYVDYCDAESRFAMVTSQPDGGGHLYELPLRDFLPESAAGRAVAAQDLRPGDRLFAVVSNSVLALGCTDEKGRSYSPFSDVGGVLLDDRPLTGTEEELLASLPPPEELLPDYQPMTAYVAAAPDGGFAAITDYPQADYRRGLLPLENFRAQSVTGHPAAAQDLRPGDRLFVLARPYSQRRGGETVFPYVYAIALDDRADPLNRAAYELNAHKRLTFYVVSYTPGDAFAKVSRRQDGSDPLFLPMENLRPESVTRAPVAPGDIRPGDKLLAYGPDFAVLTWDGNEERMELPLIEAVVLDDQ